MSPALAFRKKIYPKHLTPSSSLQISIVAHKQGSGPSPVVAYRAWVLLRQMSLFVQELNLAQEEGSWVRLAGSVSSMENGDGKWANFYRKMSYHNTGNLNINRLSKLLQFSTKCKSFLLWGSRSFSQAKVLFLHKKLFFSQKFTELRTLFFLIHKLFQLNLFFSFAPSGKNDDFTPFSVFILNTCLLKAKPTESEDCSLGVKEKLRIPWICSAVTAQAFPGC